MGQQLLDPLPIVAIPLAFVIIGLLAYEIGFRLGRWWQDRTPGEQEGPTGVLVGSLLALMAFLLAVTMSMASDRFDARRGLVLAEANSIGTTYLRAGYLPQPTSEDIRALLREYVPLRIVESSDRTQLAADLERSTQIQAELWSRAEDLVRTEGSSDLLALFIESLNETIDLHESRVTAGLYARVPETVVLLLFGGAILTIGMVGFSAGLTRRRSLLSATVLVLALGAVLMVVVDMDRSRDGYLQVNQQPLIDLQESLAEAGDPASLGRI